MVLCPAKDNFPLRQQGLSRVFSQQTKKQWKVKWRKKTMKVMKKRLISHRKFNTWWLNDYSWLKRNSEKRMLCELCIRFGKQSSFTTGCTNFKTSSLTRHAESTDLRNALLASNTQTDLKQAIARALTHQEEAITIAQKTAYWLP